jgi:hypothetical protein
MAKPICSNELLDGARQAIAKAMQNQKNADRREGHSRKSRPATEQSKKDNENETKSAA